MSFKNSKFAPEKKTFRIDKQNTLGGGKVSSPKEEQKTLQGLNVGFKKRKSSVECSL